MPNLAQPSRRHRHAEQGRLVALHGGQLDLRRTNLPAPISSFIGREAELTEISGLLRGHRLLTLTGPGGAGKTRLAMAAASELVEVFDDGVWIIDLAPLSDPSLVPQAVALPLDVREQPGRPLPAILADYLRAKSLLLVLDNCEHLIDACAMLAHTLLRSCPKLHIVCTSREPLNVDGEIAWPVPALTHPVRQERTSPEILRTYEAVRLFLDRASAVNPSFTLTAANAPAVAQICSGLDGIPLALELAAARTKVFSPQEIANRLDDSLRFLVEGGRTNAPRHRTLQATIEWSHDLLSKQEQILFRRLAVFSGGFTLDAAEAVASADALSREGVLPLVSHLVDKSLLAVVSTESETRYRMLDTVRHYANEELVRCGEHPSTSRRHARYFLGFAEAAEQKVNGPAQLSALQQLEADHDNLRAALAWSLEVGETELGLRLAASLWAFWFIRGYLSEGRRWLEQVITRDQDGVTLARAKALVGAGMLATFQEDYDAAEPPARQGLALFRELENVDGIAVALTSLGTLAFVGQRAHLAAADLIAEALALRPQVQDKRLVAQMLDLEGGVALSTDAVGRAESLWQQSLAIARDCGNSYGEAFTLSNLGLLAAALGDHVRAGDLLRQSLRLSVDLGYKLIIQYGLIGLGKINAARDRADRAVRLWAAAETMSEAYGTHLTRAARAVINYEGELAAARKQLGEVRWSAAWEDGRTLTQEQAVAYALDDQADEPPQPATYPVGLSAREVEVLRLVANGSTNAAVAKELFLSTRTVDWHLSSIYTKLGVRTRTEAARFAVDQGLV